MSAPSRIVVAGGTGLIGRELVSTLAADGHEVVVLTRAAPESVSLPHGTHAVRWDGRTSDGWATAVDGARALVNLAGASIAGGRWSEKRKREIVDSRTSAATAIEEAVRRSSARPEVLLQASAVGIYGDRGDLPLDESSRAGKGFLAATAVAWEESGSAVETLGVRRVILRTGLVLARGGGALPAMARPFRFALGGRLGSGQQWMPWIHLADQISAIVHLMDDRSARGAYNLCAPEPVRNSEFTRELARALKRPAVFAVPAPVLRAVLGEMAELVLGGQRLTPRRLLDTGFRFRFPGLPAALRDLLG